jgi:hypothetical protein
VARSALAAAANYQPRPVLHHRLLGYVSAEAAKEVSRLVGTLTELLVLQITLRLSRQ